MKHGFKVRTPLLALIFLVFGLGYTFAHNKVVVVPLGGDASLEDLQEQINDLKTLLAGVTRAGDNLYFTGLNLHIRNGSGATTPVNGVGNLIIGYNEKPYCPSFLCLNRIGSHNVIIGSEHSYTSYGGLVSGFGNKISGSSSAVIGSYMSEANGDYSVVSGGAINKANGHRSTVSGGYNNTADGLWSTVSGGEGNNATELLSVVSGGRYNSASGNNSTVSGGRNNSASGSHSTVSGGRYNSASGSYSTVSGGYTRSVSGQNDWRAGSLFETQ